MRSRAGAVRSRAGAVRSRAGAVRSGAGAMRSQLREAVLRLRQVQSAVVVAVAALRQQNCERDEDIAVLLQECVADRVQDQIDQLELTLREAQAQARRTRPH